MTYLNRGTSFLQKLLKQNYAIFFIGGALLSSVTVESVPKNNFVGTTKLLLFLNTIMGK